MERGDIGTFSVLSQACVWEGVLASPPEGLTKKARYKLAERSDDWETAIQLWKPLDLAVKSLSDCVNRLNIGTDVVTFLHPQAAEPIYHWLLRKGISTSVTYYPSSEEYALDLRYNRGIRTIYVATDEDASIIGLRSHVVQPNTAWRV